jgi:hypothetical protein
MLKNFNKVSISKPLDIIDERELLYRMDKSKNEFYFIENKDIISMIMEDYNIENDPLGPNNDTFFFNISPDSQFMSGPSLSPLNLILKELGILDNKSVKTITNQIGEVSIIKCNNKTIVLFITEWDHELEEMYDLVSEIYHTRDHRDDYSSNSYLTMKTFVRFSSIVDSMIVSNKFKNYYNRKV